MPSKIDFGPEKSAEGTPKSDPGASKIHFQDALGAPVREHAPIYVQTALSDPPLGASGLILGAISTVSGVWFSRIVGMKFKQAWVNDGSNNDSLKVAKCLNI